MAQKGTTVGNLPLIVEVKLEVWDSPNSAMTSAEKKWKPLLMAIQMNRHIGRRV